MCGIAGMVSLGPGGAGPGLSATDEAGLCRLGALMAARGPDGSGLWLGPDRQVGLAHRRLAIIDPGPSGAQPMASADGALCLSFNGEIYNYRELRAGLIQDGAVLRGGSDTEVILHLYQRHGPAMVERLHGMFALALWDGRRRGLLLARDPFGIKPLYYASQPNRFLFASQARPLAALIDHGANAPANGNAQAIAAPDPAAVVGFLVFGYVPEPFTLHPAVRALPAGTTLWVDRDGAQAPRRFFSIRDVLAAAEHGSDQPHPDDLREALLGSVRRHLVADVPVGLFLSAGIDSGTLLALATEAAGPGLITRTLGFDEFRGTGQDEAPLAEAIAHRFGARHQTHILAAGGFEAARPALLAAMDQPSIDGVNTYFVARATAGSGIKVALSGVGGDELFGGYPSFRQVPALARRLAPLAGLPALGRLLRRAGAPLLPRRLSPKLAGLVEYGTSVPDAWLLRRALFMPWELGAVLEPELAEAGWAALDARARLADTVADLRSPRLQVMALEMGWYLRDQLLRDADWAGMAHGLEIRTPWVDATLFRHLAPLLAGPRPPGKSDLLATARPPLPEAVAQRPKTGFATPLSGWLSAHRPGGGRRGLRDWALEVLRPRLGAELVSP